MTIPKKAPPAVDRERSEIGGDRPTNPTRHCLRCSTPTVLVGGTGHPSCHRCRTPIAESAAGIVLDVVDQLVEAPANTAVILWAIGELEWAKAIAGVELDRLLEVAAHRLAQVA